MFQLKMASCIDVRIEMAACQICLQEMTDHMLALIRT
jgi:hypothetical protein